MALHTKKSYIFLLFCTFLGLQCQEKPKNDTHNHETEGKSETITITLTNTQKNQIALKTQSFDTIMIGKEVVATGLIDVPPDQLATVHSIAEGFIRKMNILNGDFVQQGQILATLEHPNYIQMQENYLQITSELQYLTQEYERQKTLQIENASAKKQFQRIETDFNIQKTKQSALASQLEYLGIVAKNISPQNLQKQIFVFSPLRGYVKSVKVNLGKFIMPQDILFEIVGDGHKHIELKVPEKDALLIEKGQKVYFKSPNATQKEIEGHVFLVGKTIENAPNSAKIAFMHIHFDNESEEAKFLVGMYVQARIQIAPKKTIALPNEAIIYEGKNPFIFAEINPTKYERIPVEIIGETPKGVGIALKNNVSYTKWVTKGAYYLQAHQQAQHQEDDGHGH